MFEPVALDLLDAVIPGASLDRIGGSLAQRLDDVCGRLDPSGRERLCRAGGEKLLGDLDLAPDLRTRRLHPRQLRRLLGQPFAVQPLAFGDLGQLLTALAPAERFDGFAVGGGLLDLSAPFLLVLGLEAGRGTAGANSLRSTSISGVA
jgi:hypothetical protein